MTNPNFFAAVGLSVAACVALHKLVTKGGACDTGAKQKAAPLKNSAFVFVKPAANTEATRALVRKVLKEVKGEEIDKKKLIDQHYYAIASKATLTKPKDLPVPADKFEAKFGIGWKEALDKNLVFNAADACAHMSCTADELNAKWAMRSGFVAPGFSIYYFVVEWDAKDLSWESFRGDVLGPTDPATAPTTSLRGMILRDYKSLGIANEPFTGENGVHASASPLEGLAERANWLGANITKDTFGAALMKAGVSKKTIEAWSVDPQVTHAEGKGSVFDLLEDLDADACVAKCLTIKA